MVSLKVVEKIDTAEFLSAVGTFLATLAAFVSVGVIVLRKDPHAFWTIILMLGSVVGVVMQIIAGAMHAVAPECFRLSLGKFASGASVQWRRCAAQWNNGQFKTFSLPVTSDRRTGEFRQVGGRT
jgi:hypothetical protein